MNPTSAADAETDWYTRWVQFMYYRFPECRVVVPVVSGPEGAGMGMMPDPPEEEEQEEFNLNAPAP
jgi:hypothetical protein